MEKSKILLKPLTTEKSVSLNESNQHVFLVDKSANKIEIIQAVKELYGIKPVSCRVVRLPSKSNTRKLKRRPCKKAILNFAKDSKFDSTKLK